MSNSWYKNKEDGSRRRPIKMGSDSTFKWVESAKIENCYSIVTANVNDVTYNFYVWSDKTVKTARKYYDNQEFDSSLSLLKKYSFDINHLEEEDGTGSDQG